MTSSKAKRAAFYIRESTEEQDKGFSPANQERTIREYAKRNRFKIVNEKGYKDLLSGQKASNRNDFQRMIADAEKGKFDAILIYHTSRFARNVQEARKYKEYLRTKLDVDVISVTQNFGDWRKPTSFLNEGINELFDAYYSKQLSQWVRESLQEKRRQGKQLGNPPLGYCKKQIGFDDTKGRPIYEQTWRVEKQEAKLVKRIFTMYATRKYSFAEIAKTLNEEGHKTKLGNPFTYSSLKDILKNRVYLGYVHSPRRDYAEVRGEHKAIISQDLFDKVQEAIEDRARSKGGPVSQKRFYLLKDLVYCYKCRKHLQDKASNNINKKMLPKMYCEAHQRAKGEKLKYSCKFKREYKNCNQPSVDVEIIDKQVLDLMAGFRLPDEQVQEVLEKLTAKMEDHSMNDETVRHIARLEKKLKKLEFRYMNMDDLTDEEYKEQYEVLQSELVQYKRKPKARQSIGKKKMLQETERYLKNFPRLWANLPPEEQRAWIQMVIRRVWVRGKKVVAVEPYDNYHDLFTIQKDLFTHASTGKSRTKRREVSGQPPLVTPVGVFCLKKIIVGTGCLAI